MISKERLEELIEKGATIYEVKYGYKSNKVVEYDLKNIPTYSKTHLNHFLDMHQVFETKEEAEWHKEFGCIERTEKLELPTWEEFMLGTSIRFRSGGIGYSLHKSFYEELEKIVIVSFFGAGVIRIFAEDLTKENYTLACRKCKELFLGETK